MRVTEKMIRARVARLVQRGLPLGVEWAYGKPRIHDTTGRDLSPRLPTGQLAVWLDGFETALDVKGGAS